MAAVASSSQLIRPQRALSRLVSYPKSSPPLVSPACSCRRELSSGVLLSQRRREKAPDRRRSISHAEARILLHRPIEQSWSGRIFAGAVFGLIAYGIYRLVSPLWVWPKEIRDELKLGMIAERRGDYHGAEAQYRKAWTLARSMSDDLGDEPLLHTTGIAAHLGRMLETRFRLKDAARVYAQAFKEIQDDENASPRERVRAAALAVRYAEILKDLPTMEWAVAELLRLANVDAPLEEQQSMDHSELEIGKLSLPSFVTKINLGAAFEQLGLLYLHKEQHDLAVPALLQALSALSPHATDFPARCRSAVLMNALATANQNDTHSAKAWANKSITASREILADGKRENKRRSTGDCRDCEVAALFNLASLHEAEGDRRQAMKLFEESFELAKRYEFDDAIVEGQKALDRIGISQPL